MDAMTRLLIHARTIEHDEGVAFGDALFLAKQRHAKLAEDARHEVTHAPSTRGPKRAEFRRMVLQRMKDKQISFDEAEGQIRRENPILARDAEDESPFRETKPDEAVLASEGIDAALNPGAALAFMAHRLSETSGRTYAAALVEIARRHRDLAMAARRASTRGEARA